MRLWFLTLPTHHCITTVVLLKICEIRYSLEMRMYCNFFLLCNTYSKQSYKVDYKSDTIFSYLRWWADNLISWQSGLALTKPLFHHFRKWDAKKFPSNGFPMREIVRWRSPNESSGWWRRLMNWAFCAIAKFPSSFSIRITNCSSMLRRIWIKYFWSTQVIFHLFYPTHFSVILKLTSHNSPNFFWLEL